MLKVKDPKGAGYPEQFKQDGSHDLTKVARFENYREFLFGSLNADVQPLQDYLGEACKMIDMIVDQANDGKEDNIKATDASKWAKQRGVSTSMKMVTFCCGQNGPIRQTAPDTPVWANGQNVLAKPRQSGWSSYCATCASIPTCS